MQYLLFGPFQLVAVYLRLEFEDREKTYAIKVLISDRTRIKLKHFIRVLKPQLE